MLWSDESFVHRDPAVNWLPLTYLTCLIAETHSFSYQHHKCSTWKIHFLQERKKHHQILEFYTFYTLIPGRTIAAFIFPCFFRNILSGVSSSICSICFLASQCVWFAISSSMLWRFCCIFWYIHSNGHGNHQKLHKGHLMVICWICGSAVETTCSICWSVSPTIFIVSWWNLTIYLCGNCNISPTRLARPFGDDFPPIKSDRAMGAVYTQINIG